MEQIPLSLILTDTVMGCPTYYRFQDDALVSERTIRIITYSIAEIMSITGRVAEVILALILMHPFHINSFSGNSRFPALPFLMALQITFL